MAHDNDQPGITTGRAARPRRARDRARTEADLLAVAFELLQRDGVFAGLNLQEVAERAGVNRGQIYQYFGDRRSLLRAAVASHAREWAAGAKRHWEMPFARRRGAMFRAALANPQVTQVEALLAIDGDTGYHALPELARTEAALDRDQRTGELSADADAVAMHVLMVAAYKGYLIFRESFARDVGVPVEQLDARVLAAHDQVLAAVTGQAEPAAGEPDTDDAEVLPANHPERSAVSRLGREGSPEIVPLADSVYTKTP